MVWPQLHTSYLLKITGAKSKPAHNLLNFQENADKFFNWMWENSAVRTPVLILIILLQLMPIGAYGNTAITNILNEDEFVAAYTLEYPENEIKIDQQYSAKINIQFDFSKSWKNFSEIHVDGIYIHHLVDDNPIGSTPIWDGFKIISLDQNIFNVTANQTIKFDNKWIFKKAQTTIEIVATIDLQGYKINQQQTYRETYSAKFEKINGPEIKPTQASLAILATITFTILIIAYKLKKK